uniref:Uncharacterized protein n=1 Tax=Heterorhabditis bacteriophora TaxID=37862 RepID=A0A1I7XGJ0_HETBA
MAIEREEFETGRHQPPPPSGRIVGGATLPAHRQTHPCNWCEAYVWNAPESLALLSLLLLLVATSLTMYKVLRSYSKKAERKQEVSRAADSRNGHTVYENGRNGHAVGYTGNGYTGNGQLLAVDNRHLSNAYAAGQAFSESSSYETREHFERKVQRVKKTRGERERSRSARRGDEVGNLNDLISRLTRGIGITNEKLDLILQLNGIIEDLNSLESPISGFFEDVEELKTHNHPEANDFYRQVYGLHQRRTAYLDRLTNQLLVRLGIRTENLRKENAARLESIRASTFNRVEECIEWVRSRLVREQYSIT